MQRALAVVLLVAGITLTAGSVVGPSGVQRDGSASLGSRRPAESPMVGRSRGGSTLTPSIGASPTRPGVSLMAAQVTSGPDTAVVLDSCRYTSTSSTGWTYFLVDFDIDNYDALRRHEFRITNGDPNTSHRITQLSLTLNGTQVLNTYDVTANIGYLVKLAKPLESNQLYVALKGPVGNHVDIDMLSMPDPAYAVDGPTQCTLTSTTTIGEIYDDGFAMVDTASGPYVLTLTNGAANGSQRVTSAAVYLNGNLVVQGSECGLGTASLWRQVSLDTLNEYTVVLKGSEGAYVTLCFDATDITAPALSVTLPVADMSYVDSTGIWVSGSVADETPGTVQVDTLTPHGTTAPTTGFADSMPLPADGVYPVTVRATNSAGFTTEVVRTVIRDTQAPVFTALSPAADTTSDLDTITVAGSWADLSPTRVTVNGDTVGASSDTGSFNWSVPLDLGANRVYVSATDTLGHDTLVTRIVWRDPPECTNCDTTLRGASALTAVEVASFRNQVGFIFRGKEGQDPVQTGAGMDTTMITVGSEAVIRGFVIGRDYGVLPGVTVSVLGHPEFGSTKTLDDGAFDLVVNGGATYALRFTRADFLEAQRPVHAPVLDFAVMDTVALIGRSRTWYYADSTAARTIVGRFESDLNDDRRIYLLVPRGEVAAVTRSTGDVDSLSQYRIRLKEFTVGSDGPSTMPGQLPPTTAYTYCVDMSLVEADSITDLGGPEATPVAVTFTMPIVTYVREFLGLPVGTVVPSGYYDAQTGTWIPDENGRVVGVVSVAGGVADLDTDGDGAADSLAQYESAGIDELERQSIASLFAPGDSLWRMRVTHFSPHDFNLNMNEQAGLASFSAARAGTGGPLIDDPEETCNCVIENENRVLGETIPVKGTPYSLSYRSSRQPGDKASRWLRIPLTGSTVPDDLRRVHLVVEVAGRRFSKAFTGVGENRVEVFDDWDGMDVYGRRVPGSTTATVKIGYEFQQEYSMRAATGGKAFGNSASIASAPGYSVGGDRDIGNVSWSTQKVSIGAPSMASAGLGGWTLTPHHFYDTNGRGALYLGDGLVRYGYLQNPVIHLFAGTGRCPSAVPDSTVADRLAINLTVERMTFGPDGSLYYFGRIGTGPYAPMMVFRMRPDGTTIPWVGCVNPIGGTTSQTNYPVDGQLATSNTSRLVGPCALAAGPDGSLYVADEGWQQVYRITPDDTLHVVAGQPLATGAFVEGSVAKTQALNYPTAVATGPDGSVYVAMSGYKRVVRIGRDGLIYGFAGNGGDFSGADGKADSLGLGGNIPDIVADRQGNVYMAIPYGTSAVLRQVTPDGRMRTLNGPDHGFNRLALGSADELYTGGGSYPGVVLRDIDGTLATIAGTFPGSASTDFSAEEGGLARAAVLTGFGDLAVGLDGRVYVSQGGSCEYAEGNRIRVIGPESPPAAASEMVYPSADGREAYHFTLTGRHLRTVDVITGDTLYSFGYDAAGRLTDVRDRNRNMTSIERREADGVPEAIIGPYSQRTELELDANGYLARARDASSGLRYAMTYSSDGLLETFTHPDTATTKTQVFSYGEEDGRLSTSTDAAGGVQSLEEVSNTGVTQTVERTTDEDRVTHYTVTRMMDGLRRRLVEYPSGGWSYAVDSVNTTTPPYRDVRVEVGAAGESTITFTSRDKRYGILAAYPEVACTVLPSGLRRTQTASRDTLINGMITETYGINGDVFTSTYTPSTRTLRTVSPQQRASNIILDNVGRPIRFTVEGDVGLDPVELYYDEHGNLLRLDQGKRGWRFDYDLLGRLDVMSDTLHRRTFLTHDVAGRVEGATLPGNRSVGYDYDGNGNLTGLATPNGYTHRFSYSAVDLNGGYTAPSVPGVLDSTTIYSYNGDRQLEQVTRPDGQLILARYGDATGLLDSLTQTRGRNEFSYMPNGQLQTVTSPDGITVEYGYDGPRLRCEAWLGLRGQASVDSVSTVANIAFLDSIQTVNDVSAVAFGYDADGLLTSMVVNGVTESITRRDGDGLISRTTAGVVSSEHSYNSHGELSTLSYTWTGGSFEQELTRDSLGRIERITESGLTPHAQDYHYDEAGRLDTVTVDGVRQAYYTYDLNGNRRAWHGLGAADTATADYDAQDRLLRYADAGYAYTDAGELTARIGGAGDTLLTSYDALGNLTGARAPNGDSLTYLIDGANRRVGRILNGLRTHTWLYQNGLNLIAEVDTTGAIASRYVYGTLGHVPDLLVKGADTYRLITDHLGSVRAVVNVSTGAVAEQISYDAWGNVTLDTNPGFVSHGFAGGLRDTSTELVRFGARDYDPSVGRWTDKDPLRFSRGSQSLYAYSGDDPINRMDPTGLAAMPEEPSDVSVDADICEVLRHHRGDWLWLAWKVRPFGD